MNTIVKTTQVGDITTITCHDLDGVAHEFKVQTDDFERYQSHEPIQHAFPYLSDDDREIIITGMTPKMWELLEDSF